MSHFSLEEEATRLSFENIPIFWEEAEEEEGVIIQGMVNLSPYLKETRVGGREEEEKEGEERVKGEVGGEINQNLMSEEEECFHFCYVQFMLFYNLKTTHPLNINHFKIQE